MIKLTPEKPPYYEIIPTIKIYRALLTQSGTNPPTTIELLNTMGLQITWTRDGAGSYVGETNIILNQNKTTLMHANNGGAELQQSLSYYLDGLLLVQINTVTNMYTDGLGTFPIEITTY